METEPLLAVDRLFVSFTLRVSDLAFSAIWVFYFFPQQIWKKKKKIRVAKTLKKE